MRVVAAVGHGYGYGHGRKSAEVDEVPRVRAPHLGGANEGDGVAPERPADVDGPPAGVVILGEVVWGEGERVRGSMVQ